jgi:hypothetical protein
MWDKIQTVSDIVFIKKVGMNIFVWKYSVEYVQFHIQV